MNNNNDVTTSLSKNYIRRNIRKIYFKRLCLPFLCLFALVLIAVLFPFREYVMPERVDEKGDLSIIRDTVGDSVEMELNDLYFTGYTSSFFSRPNGYYYYTMHNGRCLIVLLSPETCEEGVSSISSLTVKAVIKEPGKAYEQLLFSLSSDLNWTTDGLLEQMEGVYLDEVALSGIGTKIFLVLFLIVFVYFGVYVLLVVLFVLFPGISPAVLTLWRFGNPWRILEEAEEELSTLPQLATEDMFITENYFIEISTNGVAIVPIKDIIWIYKHSTLHKLLWYHFEISYTLHIRGSKRFYVKCPKNSKSNIDGVIDYLAEANHDILVGLNEENRVKAQTIQRGKINIFEKIVKLLKKHI